MGGRYRQIAWEIAVGQYGYVRAVDAVEAGIPLVELGKLAREGRLDHVGYGLYRFAEFPVTGRDSFFEAVARVGDAHLVGESVLALHGLAQVNPVAITVGVARRVRRRLPPWIALVRDSRPAAQLTVYEAIPTTTVAAALDDCRSVLLRERFETAVGEAEADGLISAAEAAHLRGQ